MNSANIQIGTHSPMSVVKPTLRIRKNVLNLLTNNKRSANANDH